MAHFNRNYDAAMRGEASPVGLLMDLNERLARLVELMEWMVMDQHRRNSIAMINTVTIDGEVIK